MIHINEWDSALFGFISATLKTEVINEAILSDLDQKIAEKKIRFLQYLSPCEQIENIHQLEKAGFHFVDIRYTFEKQLSEKNIAPEVKTGIKFDLANPSHIPELLSISAGLYKDTRYYADALFPRDKVSMLYDEWISNAIYGKFDDLCYCLFIENLPIAFCTLRFLENQSCILGLFGVSSQHQRQSFGSYLLQSMMADLYKKGIKTIQVVTQGKNYNAQRTYQANGFKTLKIDMWYHKWF